MTTENPDRPTLEAWEAKRRADAVRAGIALVTTQLTGGDIREAMRLIGDAHAPYVIVFLSGALAKAQLDAAGGDVDAAQHAWQAAAIVNEEDGR